MIIDSILNHLLSTNRQATLSLGHSTSVIGTQCEQHNITITKQLVMNWRWWLNSLQAVCCGHAIIIGLNGSAWELMGRELKRPISKQVPVG